MKRPTSGHAGGIILAGLVLGCAGGVEGPLSDSAPERVHLPSGIAQLTGNVTPLRQISAADLNRTVQIEGKVTERVPLLETVLYQVRDKTGQIWVQSSTSAPQVGDQVRLRGIVRYESIVVSGTDQGEFYLEEVDRLSD